MMTDLMAFIKAPALGIASVISERQRKAEGTDKGAGDGENEAKLSTFERVANYSKSSVIVHRVKSVRDIGEYCNCDESSVEDVKNHFVPVLEHLIRDLEDSVRSSAMEQIPDIVRFFLKDEENSEDSYQVVLCVLLGLVAELTTDTHAIVRQNAVESLIAIGELIKPEDVQAFILPIVKSLGNDATEEEHRVESVILFDCLAHLMGDEICKEVILPFFEKLSDDPVFRVRKAVAGHLSNISKHIGTELTCKRILRIFIEMSKDEIWGVRKACVSSLIGISEMTTSELREGPLLKVCEALLLDSSRWVRSSAFEHLGEFIVSFGKVGKDVNPKLINHYVLMPGKYAEKFGDNDIKLFCAFNFPAVLETVTNELWPQLSECYFLLVRDPQLKVRRTLSYSLHEIARILGTAITEDILLPVFELFLRDMDEVKAGVIKHVTSFLKILGPETRQKYITYIEDIQQNVPSWRFRRMISKQLGDMASLFSPEISWKFLVPILMNSCKDNVFSVRKAAFKSVGSMFLAFENSPYQQDFHATLKKLVLGEDAELSLCRQMYIQICYYLLDKLDEKTFTSMFLPPVHILAVDPFNQVRISVAKLMAKMLSLDMYSNREDVVNTAGILKKDYDKSVSDFMNRPLPQTTNTNINTNSNEIS